MEVKERTVWPKIWYFWAVRRKMNWHTWYRTQNRRIYYKRHIVKNILIRSKLTNYNHYRFPFVFFSSVPFHKITGVQRFLYHFHLDAIQKYVLWGLCGSMKNCWIFHGKMKCNQSSGPSNEIVFVLSVRNSFTFATKIRFETMIQNYGFIRDLIIIISFIERLLIKLKPETI